MAVARQPLDHATTNNTTQHSPPPPPPPPPHERSTSTTTTMPYNTRRKSLSLTELGIIPKRSRAQSHTTPQAATSHDAAERPSKKARHTPHAAADSPPRAAQPGSMSPPRRTAIRVKETRPRNTAQLSSPPPSPVREGDHKIITEGINDDIVIGVIEQLEKTGNRPHLVKEFAAILASSVPAVEKSANPCALISSRLTTYLARARPTFSPCPIAKLIEPVHPRRLFFYLTTLPQRPLPSAADIYQQIHRITPSLSSHDEDEEQDEYEGEREVVVPQRSRTELSPSPEVDLSSPDLDDHDESAPASPSRSFPTHGSASQDRHASPKNLLHNRRAASPQLEPEERTFKQTANQLFEQAQQRHNSLKDVEMETHDSSERDVNAVDAIPDESHDEENTERKNSEAAAELFAQHAEHLHLPVSAIEFSSPMIMPQASLETEVLPAVHTELARHDEVVDHMSLDVDVKDVSMESFSWESLQSPENVELAELDNLLDAY